MRRPMVVGNWKMHGSLDSSRELISGLAGQWSGVHQAEVVVCPPFIYLPLASELLADTNIEFGAQNCSQHVEGAFTGQISPKMLAEFGCKYTIVGHSERRANNGETSEIVALKFEAALEQGMIPILCVGETEEQRESGHAFDVIGSQLLKVIDRVGLAGVARGVVAYEPVWAIGTGKTATPDIAQDVHAYIRETLGPEGDQVRVLYGGSVKPENAADLFSRPDIDGALVGGAALDADSFAAICRAAE